MHVPEGWEYKKLEQIAAKSKYSMVDGPFGSNLKSEHYRETGRQVLQSGFVTSGKFEAKSYVFVDEDLFVEQKRSAAIGGDILMAKIGAQAGRCAIIPLDHPASIIAGNCLKISVDQKNNVAEYIQAVLARDYEKNGLVEIKTETAQPAISLKNLKSYKILTPPLPEQQKIAQILSTWDKAIEKLEALIAAKQKRKKALMQQLLTGKKRFAGFEGEWKIVKIKDCAECLDNRRVPLNNEERSKMQGAIPYWGANGIVDYINEFIFDESIVLLAEDGGYFDEYSTRAIANISHGKAWVNNHAHVLRAKSNTLNEWLYYSLVHKNILAFVNGGTRAKLNNKSMLMIHIPLPPIDEQQKIASVLTAADTEIDTHKKQLATLKEQKKGLMQQLLTGKKRVKVEAHV
jgi:type I restriction enzyme, S subunit